MVSSAAEQLALRERLGPEAWRAACRAACWRAGRLDYALHSGQRAAREMVTRVHREAVDEGGVKRALLNIARRWGKTFFFVVYVLEVMLRKPGARVPYAAMSEVSVREFVEPILRELAVHAPPELRPREHKGEWIIPASNSPLHDGTYDVPPGRDGDSRLIVKGCEDRTKANRLRGPAADAFVIDEAGFIGVLDYVVKDVASAQLITTDGMMLVGSSAPESPEHEFWKLADEAQSRGAYMHATVYDAPHLTPKQIKSFAAEVGGEHTLAWQREGLSRKVVDITKAVYPEWAQAELDDEKSPGLYPPIIDVFGVPEFFDFYIVGDLGFSDLSMVLLAFYDFERARLCVLDEVETRRQTSDVIEAETRAKQQLHFGQRKPLVRSLEGDALVVAAIRKEERIARGEAQRGVPEEPGAEEPEDARWSQIAFVQMEAAVNAVRIRIKRRGLVVHERCKTLIAHMRGAVWNESRTDFVRIKGQHGHHFDGAAAMAYLVKKLQPNRNPMPVVPHGVTHYTHRIPPELTESGREQKLKRAFGPRRDRR